MRFASVLLLLSCAAFARELQHDDGKQAGKRSSAGTGHVISFKAPSGKWWVTSVLVYGTRYGGGYDPSNTFATVSVCDEKLTELSAREAAYERFAPGRFDWVELATEPAQVSGRFAVCVSFSPTRTKGVFVGWANTKESHSAFGLPGERPRPFDKEWMIRVRLTKKKPKGVRTKAGAYRKDFDYLARTVRTRYPALKKKKIDWKRVCDEWRPRFDGCKDDRSHLLNVHQLLALLRDSHTGVTKSKVNVHVPSFDGLYGGGLWIAVEGERLLVRASLREDIPPGTTLLEIDQKPARDAHAAVCAQVRRWHGWSSQHFLDARLSFQFFAFGEKQAITIRGRLPDGTAKEWTLKRWGPGGRGISRIRATMPPGIEYAKGALSGKLDDETGYLRITGSMNDSTRAAFFAALDHLRGVKGILLDCRGMGGGGDSAAWAMAGRFAAPKLRRTGDWQFEGPVVMLQDERMISSAETFTWAMAESGRALSVGRPTGGATIIPKVYRAPSGLFEFRMGSHDRRTPFAKVQPEGIGSAPDIHVSYDLLAKHEDPVLAIGRDALKRLVAGEDRSAVIKALGR
ncbi:MAG: S41 family peptidase [Planctomycetota bacterium]